MSPSDPVGAAVPVGDDAAGLSDQQAACGDVPGAEGQFEEAVEDAIGHPGEVQAGGAPGGGGLERARAAVMASR